ncbi:hypothetical protein EV182_005841, partial [Spiromyces aspiralis]
MQGVVGIDGYLQHFVPTGPSPGEEEIQHRRFVFWHQNEIWRRVRMRWTKVSNSSADEQQFVGPASEGSGDRYIDPRRFFKFTLDMAQVVLKGAVKVEVGTEGDGDENGPPDTSIAFVPPESTKHCPLCIPARRFSYLCVRLASSEPPQGPFFISIYQPEGGRHDTLNGARNQYRHPPASACQAVSVSDALFVESMFPPQTSSVSTPDIYEGDQWSPRGHSAQGVNPFLAGSGHDDDGEREFKLRSVATLGTPSSGGGCGESDSDALQSSTAPSTTSLLFTSAECKTGDAMSRARMAMARTSAMSSRCHLDYCYTAAIKDTFAPISDRVRSYGNNSDDDGGSGSGPVDYHHPQGVAGASGGLFWQPVRDHTVHAAALGLGYLLRIPLYPLRRGEYCLFYDIRPSHAPTWAKRQTG